MKLGTKSLLFGCHQFILHPFFTIVAWYRLYRGCPLPGLWSTRLIAAIIHDWGYWGCPTMDGPCGDQHTIWGANIIHRLTGSTWWYEELLLHSRFFAKRMDIPPSNFCWVDKLSTAIYPSWLWATLAYLSGEGWEYMENPMYEIHQPGEERTWVNLLWFHRRLRKWTYHHLNNYGWKIDWRNVKSW